MGSTISFYKLFGNYIHIYDSMSATNFNTKQSCTKNCLMHYQDSRSCRTVQSATLAKGNARVEK